MSFVFTSSTLDLVESFWKFVIPEQNLSVPFLLVGNTQDPHVVLDRSHLNFKSLLIGHEATETVYITNNETVSPFSFSILESTCHAAGQSASLQLNPMTGIVPPKATWVKCDAHIDSLHVL